MTPRRTGSKAIDPRPGRSPASRQGRAPALNKNEFHPAARPQDGAARADSHSLNEEAPHVAIASVPASDFVGRPAKCKRSARRGGPTPEAKRPAVPAVEALEGRRLRSADLVIDWNERLLESLAV